MSSPNPNHQPKSLQPQPSHNQQQQQQQQQQNHQASPIPIQYRAISRNNSNTSTTSSSNKGEFSSTISTTNSVTSSRSQLSKLIDHRQLLTATCGASSTPIRSFQRATISSVVKTRAFDNNPVLQGLLATSAAPSGQNSVSNSQTPSPLSTPVFSRSRSLRMSGGPRRYQQSPQHFRATSRTPDLYSFNNSGDLTGYSSNDSQVKLLELTSERSELKESLEFLECERQVLIDSARELKDTLQKERSRWKRESEELKKHLTDSIAARVKAESQLTQIDVGANEAQAQIKRLTNQLQAREELLGSLKRSLETSQADVLGLRALNQELQRMLTEKLRYNGMSNDVNRDGSDSTSDTECVSIVTEMARLRLELNEKDKIIESFNMETRATLEDQSKPLAKASSYDIETLNKFLDQTVECIKSWPEELAGSSHVQDLMKSLLSAYKPEQDELSLRMRGIHL